MDTYIGLESDVTRTMASLNVTEYLTSRSVTGVTSSLGNESTSDGYVLVQAQTQRIIIIAVLMAFTIIGNMTLIFVLMCKKSRRVKRVNILLINLAFGDLAVAMFVNSTEILFVAFGDWHLGPALCKISVYVQMICLSSATNLLTAMSIDRYQVIVKPMQSLAKRPRIWLKIAIAWVLSLIFPIPQLFVFVQEVRGLTPDGTPKRVCGSTGYTANWQRKVYFTYTTIYILVVPTAVMLYCYAKIIRVVWIRGKTDSRRRPTCLSPTTVVDTRASAATSGKNMLGNGKDDRFGNENNEIECGCSANDHANRTTTSTKRVRWVRNVKDSTDSCTKATVKGKKGHNFSDDDLKSGSPRMSIRRSLVTASKRRVLVMTLTVVLSFLVCHASYFILTLIKIYTDQRVDLDMAISASESLVMVHSTLNPVLYGLFTLRQYHLKHILSLLTCSQPPSNRLRVRQHSHERKKLITSVRSKLGSFNSSGTTTTTITTTTFISSRKHTDPLMESKNSENFLKSSPKSCPKDSPAASPSAIEVLARFRGRSKPPLTQDSGGSIHNSDAVSLGNTEMLHLTHQHGTQPNTSTQTELNRVPPCTPMASSHILEKNGTSSSSVCNRKPEAV